MRRRMILFLLLVGILGIVLVGNAAFADRQCYQPYFYLYGQRYQTKVCIPCMNGICPYVAPPEMGGINAPAGVHAGIGH